MKIKKGIILAGGLGTRLHPQTKITNKHLLPIYTLHQGAIPMIWYPLNTLIKSGVKEILIVSSQEHCGHFIEFLGDGKQFDISLSYKVQDHNNPKIPLGIASALSLAKEFVFPDNNFAVILGDNFFENTFKSEFDFFSNVDDGCFLFLKHHIYPERFGVAYFDESQKNLLYIEEKPKNPKSNSIVTGLYLYTKSVFDYVKHIKPSWRNELEITDINNFYCQNHKSHFAFINGFWSDMGMCPTLIQTQEWINNNKYFIFEDKDK